jgi:ArsR family transcriptional regulator
MDILLAALRAAAEATRLRLLALCAEGEVTVGELVRILGQSQPRVSRHLKLLCDAGLLDRFREGSRVFYRLHDGAAAGDSLARHLVALLPADDAQLALDRRRFSEIKAERAASAAEFFRANAPRWDSIRSLHVDEAEVEGVVLDVLPGPVGDLLDIGTGTGRMLQLFAGRIERGVGIDTSRDMLTVARANLEAAGLRNCHVRQADMYGLAMADESFDAVIIHQVLHYADRPDAAIAEAARVLRPSGRMLIVDFASHDVERLRTEFAHRRLGFGAAQVSEWLSDAGLAPGMVRHLPGGTLTVTVWTGTRNSETEQETAPRTTSRLRAEAH